jgi:hypothetical protein
MKLRGTKKTAANGFELEHSTSQQRRHPNQDPSPPNQSVLVYQST